MNVLENLDTALNLLDSELTVNGALMPFLVLLSSPLMSTELRKAVTRSSHERVFGNGLMLSELRKHLVFNKIAGANSITHFFVSICNSSSVCEAARGSEPGVLLGGCLTAPTAIFSEATAGADNDHPDNRRIKILPAALEINSSVNCMDGSQSRRKQ
jgi:hypothetical protein